LGARLGPLERGHPLGLVRIAPCLQAEVAPGRAAAVGEDLATANQLGQRVVEGAVCKVAHQIGAADTCQATSAQPLAQAVHRLHAHAPLRLLGGFPGVAVCHGGEVPPGTAHTPRHEARPIAHHRMQGLQRGEAVQAGDQRLAVNAVAGQGLDALGQGGHRAHFRGHQFNSFGCGEP
jgi:hypothetical protein